MKITGRIKELIITAGGESISPTNIEDAIKLERPALSNIMVVGEQQKFLAAVMTFKCDIDLNTNIPSKNLTNEAKTYFKNQLNLNITTSDEAMKNAEVLKHLQKCVEQANNKAVSRAHHIRKWKIVPIDFSLPGGELTPTLKLKRKVAEKKYKAIIDEMYDENATPKL